ncbi:MAG: CpaF family protein [Holosporales bacterium]
MEFGFKNSDPTEKEGSSRREASTTAFSPFAQEHLLPSGEVLYQTRPPLLNEALLGVRDAVFDLILTQMDLVKAAKMPRAELRKAIERLFLHYADEHKVQANLREQQTIVDDIVDDMVGLGPIEHLMHDPSVSDILVNGPRHVYVERKGKLYLTDVRFRDDRHVVQVAQRIASRVGRRVDESSPMVDARLSDGSRVNVVIPPLAVNGPSLCIRRFSPINISLEEMVAMGTMDAPLQKFLELASNGRLNILVTGGTGAGKTTLLNALSKKIDPRERIITIEDAVELRLEQPNLVRLESRPSNLEGAGQVAIRDLVRNALRMRPDRIIIGEVRGPEAFDMLQAMNTGHDGSISTLHANNAPEAISRLINMVMMAAEQLPVHVIRAFIADAVDLIVHVARLRDGSRKVLRVLEVVGATDHEVITQDLFSYQISGVDGEGRLEGHYAVRPCSEEMRGKLKFQGIYDDVMACFGGQHD